MMRRETGSVLHKLGQVVGEMECLLGVVGR